METPTFNTLLNEGTLKEIQTLDADFECHCYLYEYKGTNYVVLSDKSVITQEEDNAFGSDHALFPNN